LTPKLGAKSPFITNKLFKEWVLKQCWLPTIKEAYDGPAMYVPHPPPVTELLEFLQDGIFTMNAASEEQSKLKKQRARFYHHVYKRTPD
jgi:hypothetical protein